MIHTKSRLLEQMRLALRRKHYAYLSEKQYLHWIRRFLCFHDLQQPRNQGKFKIEDFVNHLTMSSPLDKIDLYIVSTRLFGWLHEASDAPDGSS